MLIVLSGQSLALAEELAPPEETAAATPSEEPTPSSDPEPAPAPAEEPTPVEEPTAPEGDVLPEEPVATTPLVPEPREPFIVTFTPGTSDADHDAALAAADAVTTSAIPQLRMYAADLTESGVTALRADASVARVELDKVREVEATPNDPSYDGQWALPKIGWDTVYGSVEPSRSATVAVLDTGVDATEDLAANLVEGASMLEGDPGTTDPNGHGTAMAGIVAASTGNGVGIAGVGYAGVSVMPVKVLDEAGLGQDSDIVEGVVWATDNGADVILMSFSNPGYSHALQAAVDYAWANGVVLVAATGNDGSSAATYPAGTAKVVGVSATNREDALWSGSNYGAATFLGAPGVDIATGTGPVTGTSASAAIVAGAAALLAANDGWASNGVIVGRLARNADPAGTVEETGNGRVNLARALADDSIEEVVPAGVAGDGGPVVGPYAAAACTLASVTVGSQTPASAAPGSSVNFPITVSRSSNGTCTVGLAFSFSSTPSGGSGSIAFGTLTFSGNDPQASTTLTVNSDTAAQPGPYGFTVTATNNSLPTDSKSGTGTYMLKRSTSTVLTCTPSSIAIGSASSCNAVVTDTQSGGTVSRPTGTVSFTASGSGSLSATSCTLVSGGGTSSSQCAVNFTASGTAGTRTVKASYSGSTDHAVSTGTGTITVTSTASTSLTASSATGTYGGTTTLSATLSSGGSGISGKTVSFTLNGTAAGSATTNSSGVATLSNVSLSGIAAGAYASGVSATFAGDASYGTSSNTASLDVSKKTITVSADVQSKTYGDFDPALTYRVTVGDLVGDDEVSGELVRESGQDVGVYEIRRGTVTAGANYDLTYVPANLTIGVRAITVSADVQSKTYGDFDPALTYRVTVGDLVGDDEVSGELVRESGQDVGVYEIRRGTVTAGANYDLTYVPANLTIGVRAITVSADADPSTVAIEPFTKTYGAVDPALTYQITSGTLVGSDGFTGALGRVAGETVAGGPYAVEQNTLSLGGNYELTYVPANLTIGAATLVVDADDKWKVLGANDPVFTATLSGFAFGEDAEDAGVTDAASCTREPGESIGSYVITCLPGDLAANNYSFEAGNTGNFSIRYAWTGFLQPINDTAHQTGVVQSKFKLGQTIPAKFVLRNAQDQVVVAQAGTAAPRFSKRLLGSGCDSGAVLESVPTVAAASDPTYVWNGSHYQHNWSTKGLVPGEYRLYADLPDGRAWFVDVCLSK